MNGTESQTPASQSTPLKFPWLIMIVLMVLYTSSYIDRTVLGILVGPIKRDLGITDTEFGLLTGFAFVIFYTLSGIPLGWMVDRWNRRNLIVVGVTIWSIMTAACGFAGSFANLFFARIGVGVGEATLSPATYSMTTDLVPREKLARALSVYSLGIPIGTALASIVGGAVVQSFGADEIVRLPILGVIHPWQIVFLVIGIPGLLLAVLAAVMIREPKRVEKRSSRGSAMSIETALRYLLTNWRAYMPLFAGPALVNMFSYSVIVWYPAYLQRVHGLSIATSGLFVGFATLILGMSGTVVSGWLADRYVARGKLDGHLRVGFIYGIGIFFCGAIGPLVPVTYVALTLAALTMFFSNTWNGVSAAAVQLVTPGPMRGLISALWLFFSNLVVMTFGPLMVALITDYGFGRDSAVGYSLAMSATVSTVAGCSVLYFGFKPVAARALQMRDETRPAEY